jgi:transcriptional regulator with XRE-family HTH domain
MAFKKHDQIALQKHEASESLFEGLLSDERGQRYQRMKPHRALRKLRKSLRDDNGKKLSQTGMADILGLSLRGYQNYEYGERPIPSDILAKLGAHFDLPAHSLLSHYFDAKSYEEVCQIVDETLDLTMHLVAEYGLNLDDVRRVLKCALSKREQEREVNQDPTIGLDEVDIVQCVKEETRYFDELFASHDEELAPSKRLAQR